MPKFTKLIVKITTIAILSTVAVADDDKTKVMAIGSFHFSNPGKDVVKHKVIDVMDVSSQQYLEAVSQRIADEFKPTIVLLEYNEKNDAKYQKDYQDYINGNFDLQVNESHQLGFRIAKKAGGIPIASFDEREVHWDAADLFEVMPEVAPELQAEMDAVFVELTAEANAIQQLPSLGEVMIEYNDPERDRANKDIYILTNGVSKDGQFEGARASASWWHRNFRMYARMQAHVKPGARILIIAGQGHTAVLKDFLAIDGKVEAIDVVPLLK